MLLYRRNADFMGQIFSVCGGLGDGFAAMGIADANDEA
jgi:hypothetical protein